MNLKRKRVLVTGSDGFIGSRLLRKLQHLRAKVDQFDLSLKLDITNSLKLESYVKKKYDLIYHLAGISGTSQTMQTITNCINTNFQTTKNLIDLVLKYSPHTKIVLSGSRLEYGKPAYLPVDENHPQEPDTIYGITKLFCTQYAMSLAKSKRLNVTVFRTSNVYGPHPSKSFSGYNVINHFIDLALNNKSMTVFGKGEQKRDYIYIDDLVRGFVLASQEKANGHVYNLGFGKAIKFNKMIKTIKKIAGSGKIVSRPWPIHYQKVETGDYVSNISKIKKHLGFNPKINFKEGIEKTVNYKL